MYLQMYGIFTYIWLILMVNVVQYIYQSHASYGICKKKLRFKKNQHNPCGSTKNPKNNHLFDGSGPCLPQPHPPSFNTELLKRSKFGPSKTGGWLRGLVFFLQRFMLPEISMGFFNRWKFKGWRWFQYKLDPMGFLRYRDTERSLKIPKGKFT